MSKIKIDKGIPVPRGGQGAKGYLTDLYPFNEMEVGDSFYADKDSRNFAGTAHQVGKRLNKKFAVRKEADGCRCWRIE